MRTDLRTAMKAGRSDETRLLRVLVAALDNAEAPPLASNRPDQDQHLFKDGSAETQRLSLSPAQMRAILMAEIEERQDAAAEMTRLGQPDRAQVLHAEAILIQRYLD